MAGGYQGMPNSIPGRVFSIGIGRSQSLMSSESTNSDVKTQDAMLKYPSTMGELFSLDSRTQ